MANDRNKIFQKAKEVIVKHNLFFIEDIIAYIPISKPTFYDYYPVGSDEFNTLKELLDVNRTNLKVELRSKWFDSSAPALQMALMKLVCNDEERKMLSMSQTEVTITQSPKLIIPGEPTDN
jgi:hypothetical protein